MPDVLGYVRVSTSDQDLEVQRRRLCGEAGAIRVFDDVISGNSFDRPGLTELLWFCRLGDIICVVRLGRSLKKLLETVDGFKARGLAFRSLEERLETSLAAGELVFHVFGAIAHFKRRLIVERTRDGIAAARTRQDTQSSRPRNRHACIDAEADRGGRAPHPGRKATRAGLVDPLPRAGADPRRGTKHAGAGGGGVKRTAKHRC